MEIEYFENDTLTADQNLFRRHRRFSVRRKKSNCVAYHQTACAKLNCYNHCSRLLFHIKQAKVKFFREGGQVEKLDRLDVGRNSIFDANCAGEFLEG